MKDWNTQIYRGILTGFNEAFIIDGATKDKLIASSSKNAEIIRPILRGRDVKRYSSSFADNWIINTHNGIKEKGVERINVINDFPIVFDHLYKYKKELEIRSDKGYHWTNLRNCAYLEDLEKNKIIWIELTDHPNFCLDTEGYYINNTIFFMIGERLPYILSVLNSKLCEWYFTKIAATSGAGTRRWIKMYVDQIRIPSDVDINIENKLSEYILKVQNFKNKGTETKEIEQEIDSEIFKLFNLTDEEIKFVSYSLLTK